jgi:hypothetical protein
MRVARTVPALLLLAFVAAPLHAQEYRVRLDARAQSVSFRELVTDSIPVGDVVEGPGGGPQTPDGFAVRCGAGSHCFFFRPGRELRGMPVSTTAHLTLWGIGVEGLSLRASGRFVGDAGRDDVWPATQPAAQLIEGYVEYQRWPLTARAGRQYVSSRLEAMGFDGAWLRGRWERTALEFTGYAGWGLAQATAIPISNPALNPLDEWRPRDRQHVFGAEVAWLHRVFDVRAEYRQEIDPEDNAFVSERTAVSLGARPAHLPLRFTGGFDYNVAEGNFGSADATATYLHARYSISAGVRRYRPYFSLWTLWGAFSPVPYNAVHAAGQVLPYPWLTLLARGERYRYEDAAVTTALVPRLEDGGWRTRFGATATRDTTWIFDANVGAEHGPGASSRYADGAVTWMPRSRYSFELYAGALERPLELRFYDASTRWVGGRAQWLPAGQRRLWADVAFVDDDRDRPDAAASSLSQTRVRAGVTVTFGSSADRTSLPPARPLGR